MKPLLLILTLVWFGLSLSAQDATPIPPQGQPLLVARSLTVTPTTIRPGDAVTLAFGVFNAGQQIAQNVTVGLDGGSKFVPGTGQTTLALPSIFPGASQFTSLQALAMQDISGGPNSIPIVIRYTDAQGKEYTEKASFSVTVQTISEAALLTLARYALEPSNPQAGTTVKLALGLLNSGNKLANQVQVRLPAENGVLIAGLEGDTFVFGDVQPNEAPVREVTMIVKADAKTGPQVQPVVISYLQADGQRKEIQSSLTVDVAPNNSQPTLLLQRYDFGGETLEPGQTFEATVVLANIGTGDASDALVTFGTVSSDTPAATPGAGGGSSGSSTTPSTTFAPLGSGDTQAIGTISANAEATVTQRFVVAGSTKTGLYTLPITVRYKKPDGSNGTDSFQATVQVLAPLKLRVDTTSPLAPMVDFGIPIELAWEIRNFGTEDIQVGDVTISAEGADMLSSPTTFIGVLKGDKKAAVTATLVATDMSRVKVIFSMAYIDAMSRPQTLEYEYSAEVFVPPTPDPNYVEPLPIETPAPEAPDSSSYSLQRLILALLGLGS